MNDLDQVIRSELRDAARELLEAYGIARADDDAPEPAPGRGAGEVELAGVIEFECPELSGALVLGAPRSILDDTRAAGYACEDDWVGELANQLLGRLKNRILQYGLTIDHSAPTTVSGASEVEAVSRMSGPPMMLSTPSGEIVLRMDLDAEPGLTLHKHADAATAASEGELILF